MAATINNPQLVWINGRCHRINPTTDKANVDIQSNVDEARGLAAYQEPDLYGEDDRDFEGRIEMINNKFVSSVGIPSTFHSRLIGQKGAVKKRLEYETKCQVTIPRMGAEGPVQVTGLNRDDVISCLQRIDMILLSARQKMRPTHFLGVPLQSEEVLAKFKEFSESLANFTIPGFTPDMLTSPQKLHVTFNTMVLMDDKDRNKASTLLQEFMAAHSEEFQNISVTIKGLNSFQFNKLNKCHVLYAEVHSDALQELGNRVYSHFIKNELSFKEHDRDTVKLHMTLIKGSHGKSFDCEQMFNELKDFDFGQMTVSEVHLSQMSTVDQDTGYYKASTIVPLN